MNISEWKNQLERERQEKDRFFVPFRDATNSKETYGVDQYIDLEPDRCCNADGKWILDFNVSNYPWCAYSNACTRSFVPPKNWLQIPISAGEKKHSDKKNQDGGS